ncbi:MAG: PQQ-binding-like beta-propeller repeat protein, partial [Deltaproteobacteria bacterium]|nr:PQQ-binding-like beta-propeller repeat protein [Deltaproteobacteria bacterium]
KSATGGKVLSSPAIREDRSILVGSENGKLYAFKPEDGSEVWVFSGDDKKIRSSPIVASDGTIYFGSDDQKLHALNSSGTEKWDFVAEGMVSASPAMGFGGDIYIGTEEGKFYAVETASARLAAGLWPAFHHDARHTGRNTTNAGPTADAGTDQTVKSGNTVTLNGSNASDPDYGIPLFKWTQTEGETVNLNNDTSVTPSFSAPGVDDDKKTLTFQLEMTDNGGLTDTDTVQITVEKNDDDDGGCFIRTIRN